MLYDGRELTAKPGDIFGRGRHADVQVDGTVVSRKHAQIHRGPDGWFLTDLGSSNGLFGPDGTATERLDLGAGSTRFTLGPPDIGCAIEITIPERMATAMTMRLRRRVPAAAWPPPAVDGPVTTSPTPTPPGSASTVAAAPNPTAPPPSPAGATAEAPAAPTTGPDTDHPPATPTPAPSTTGTQTAPGHATSPAGAQTPTETPAPAETQAPTETPAPAEGPSATPAETQAAPGSPVPLAALATLPRARATAGVSARAEGISVVVGDDLTILQPTSLTLPAGSMTAIVGPSGCGKSTLANVLSGRSDPTTGTVAIDGVPIDPSVRTRIGVVPQFDAVHEQLTVRHALRAAARLRLPADTPNATVNEAVQATAETLDLDDRINTRVGRLSGGQKKRVSVGYELVSTPVMMVLDEPTSGLDPGLEQDLIEELRALADDGTTTVLVTHSPEAATQADLVIVMAPGGYLTFVGPPDEVLPHFGADDWPDVFGLLTAQTGPQWADYFAQTDLHHLYVTTPPPPPAQPAVTTLTAAAGTPGTTPASAPSAAASSSSSGGARPLSADLERSWSRDFRVMTGRYLRSIVADWKSLALLAAQAPILGLLFAAVLSQQVFAQALRPRTNAREFVLACVLAMVWIGASNSIREIVKERRTFLRERAVGVAPSALVASRWAVLGLISVLQAVVLYYTATSRQQVPLDDGVLLPSGPLEFMVFLTLIGLASVGIGLVISGLVRDANKAMAALPIVLIPVILFSGLLIPTSGNAGIEWLSWVNPIQWGSSGTAVVADVLTNEGCNPTGLQAQLQQVFLGRTVSCTNPRWQQTAGTQAVNLALALLHVAALVGVSFLVTARSTRSLRS